MNAVLTSSRPWSWRRAPEQGARPVPSTAQPNLSLLAQHAVLVSTALMLLLRSGINGPDDIVVAQHKVNNRSEPPAHQLLVNRAIEEGK